MMEDTWHLPAILPVPLTGCGSHPLLVAHHVRRHWGGKWNMLRMREGSPEHWSQFLKSQGDVPCWCSQGKVAPVQVNDQQPEMLFSPMMRIPGWMDGWWMDASCTVASCTSEGRSGTDQIC